MRSHTISFKIIFMTIFYCFQTNCATIASGPYQDLTINSSPSEADIYIDGEFHGKTPKKVRVLKKKRDLDIVIKKEGYQPESRVLDYKVLNPWALGNIAFGGVGLIGVALDYTSGAMMRFQADRVNVKLDQKYAANGEYHNEHSDQLERAEPVNKPVEKDLKRSGYVRRALPEKKEKKVNTNYKLINKLGARIGVILFNKDMHDFINDRLSNDKNLERYLENRDQKVSQAVFQFGMNLEQEVHFKGFPHKVFYGLLPYIGGLDQGFYMVGADSFGGLRLNNGFEFSLGPSFTMIDRSINLGLGYNLDYGTVQIPFKLTVNQTPRGARFGLSTGVSW